MPMNEYGEIIREGNFDNVPNVESLDQPPMTDIDMLYQADYMKYQDFLLRGVDLGKHDVVFISGLEGNPFEKIIGNDEYTIKSQLEMQDTQLTNSIYVRFGDTYKIAEITFDKNGTKKISDYQEVASVDDILEHIEHSEVFGNAQEYIRILRSQGADEKATKVEVKYKYYLENQSELEEIRKRAISEAEQGAKDMQDIFNMILNGDDIGRSVEINSISEEGTIKFKGMTIDSSGMIILPTGGISIGVPDEIMKDIKQAVQDGSLVLTEAQKKTLAILENTELDGKMSNKIEMENFKETAENSQSIEARRKVFEDLTRAKSNEPNKENERGE